MGKHIVPTKVAAIRLDVVHMEGLVTCFGEDQEGQWFYLTTVEYGPFDTLHGVLAQVAKELEKALDSQGVSK